MQSAPTPFDGGRYVPCSDSSFFAYTIIFHSSDRTLPRYSVAVTGGRRIDFYRGLKTASGVDIGTLHRCSADELRRRFSSTVLRKKRFSGEKRQSRRRLERETVTLSTTLRKKFAENSLVRSARKITTGKENKLTKNLAKKRRALLSVYFRSVFLVQGQG